MFVTPAHAQEAQPTEAEGTHGTEAPAEATHAGTEVPAEGHQGGFPPFDPAHFPSQILWIAITFALFYWFMKRTAAPRIGNILDARRDRIASDLDQAGKMKVEADAAVAAYEQELAEARANANTIGQKARDEAKAEAEAKRKQVEAELDGKLADAEKRIASIKASAMKDVGAIAEETAAAIVEQLAGKASKADVAAAVKAVAK